MGKSFYMALMSMWGTMYRKRLTVYSVGNGRKRWRGFLSARASLLLIYQIQIMLNCEWAQSLTRYDCQTIKALDGSPCLEIGTPFGLPDGSAINLYITETAHGQIRISDNADTVFQLGGMGLEVWQSARLASLRGLLQRHKLQLGDQGDAFILAAPGHAPNAFALAVTGLLALSAWAGEQLGIVVPTADIVAELEPYVIARNPSLTLKRHAHAKGASGTDHIFDLQHGSDLIDIIPANPGSTGASMRKAGDVQNGPFAEHLSPLIVVDDRTDPERAMNEIGILGSMTRAMPATRLMNTLH